LRRAVLAYVVLYVAVAAYSPYLQQYYQSLGISLATIGALAAFTSAVALVSSPTWGAIHDRYPTSRLFLPLAAGIAGAGVVGLATVGASFLLIPSAAAFAMGMAGMGPMMDVRVLDMAGSDRTRYATVRVWGSVSFMICTPIIGLAIGQNYRGLFFVALPAILLGGLAATLLPGRAGGVHGASLRRAPGRVLGHRPIALFLIGALVAWTAVYSQYAFFSIYLRQIGASSDQIGLAWSIQASLEIPSMMFFPRLSRRFGTERLIVVGMAIMTCRLIINALFVSPTILIAGSVIQGAGYGLVLIGGITFVSRQAPKGTAATAQGILNGVTFSLSSIIGSGVGGQIAGLLTIRGLYAISAGLGALSIVLFAMAVLPATRREGPVAVPALAPGPAPANAAVPSLGGGVADPPGWVPPG
jgi:MFS transporter, PPP family, 3-phenylpropionic acid transporter